MNPILYAANIGTLAAWLSFSGASTVALCFTKPVHLPELKKHEMAEIQITDGDLMDVDTFAGGSAPTQELDTQNNEEQVRDQEAVTPEVAEVPDIPEIAETEPLPEVPDLPELKPEPKPSADTFSLPKAKPTAPKASPKRSDNAKRGSTQPVARRTESGTGTGTGTAGNSGAGSGSSGTARFAGGRKPRPPYPAVAQKQGVEGSVRVSITVDESGTVVGASIVSASNSLLNDSSILSTLNRWKFSPGPRAVFVQSIKFTLK